MKITATLTAALLIALAAATALQAEDEDLFHPVDLQDLAKADPTSRSHGGTCIIAECIPDLKGIATWCGSLKKGQTLKLKGITRFDMKHGWWELHPVLDGEVIP